MKRRVGVKTVGGISALYKKTRVGRTPHVHASSSRVRNYTRHPTSRFKPPQLKSVPYHAFQCVSKYRSINWPAIDSEMTVPPHQHRVRSIVWTGAIAAITITGALYGAGLKTRRDVQKVIPRDPSALLPSIRTNPRLRSSRRNATPRPRNRSPSWRCSGAH